MYKNAWRKKNTMEVEVVVASRGSPGRVEMVVVVVVERWRSWLSMHVDASEWGWRWKSSCRSQWQI